jgi:hypothetical protein
VAAYSWLCPQGHRAETTYHPVAEGPGPAPTCVECAVPMKRWYARDNVGFAVSKLQREREKGTDKELAKVFLETAEEAATPEDPDGSKAIREWNETHEPAEVSESKAIRPEMPLHARTVL